MRCMGGLGGGCGSLIGPQRDRFLRIVGAAEEARDTFLLLDRVEEARWRSVEAGGGSGAVPDDGPPMVFQNSLAAKAR